MNERTGRLLLAALGAVSIAIGLALLGGLRMLESRAATSVIGMSGLLCGALLLRISLGVRRAR